MMKTFRVLCFALVILTATPLFAVTGTVVQSYDTFIETGVTVGDGNWIYLFAGTYSCFIYADTWTDGNVDVEVLIAGTTTTPIKVADVDVAALVDITADAFGSIGIGANWYRIEVEGSDTINWRCDRYDK